VIPSKWIDVLAHERSDMAQHFVLNLMSRGAQVGDNRGDVNHISCHDGIVQNRETTESMDLIAKFAASLIRLNAQRTPVLGKVTCKMGETAVRPPHALTAKAKAYSVPKQLFLMVLAALVIRLVVMAFLYPEQLDPYYDHWRFGYETGRVARSIVLGQGVANPLYTPTGPTAFITPIYAAILAGVFKLFGIYTKTSAFVILSLNALTSALNCIPIFYIGRKSFGERVGVWSGWVWAFFPYAIYFPVERVWSTWLSTLLFSCVFLMVLHLENSGSIRAWIGYGLLWGLAGMTEPIVLSVLSFLSLWACYRLWLKRKPWFLSAATSALAFMAVVSPWFIRNYQVFHQVIPFRDSMGLEWLIGNNGDSFHWRPREVGPWHNDAEWKEFKEIGELNYMAEKKRQAFDFMKGHPEWVLRQDLRKFVYIWTGFWSFDSRYLAEEPLDPANVAFCTTLTVFPLFGLWRAFQQDRTVAMPYALVLFIFPLIYYVTHPEVYYRRQIDPLFVVLAVYAVVSQKKRVLPSGDVSRRKTLWASY
jgi:Dolichyl-phosphate-mannose-protein mannosyltransferase